ncbi:MAG TPA: Lin0512 family protein [Methylomirabilota bacterium]|nr:Lin0512 family protein [Methylomirabilota bacterium]
MRPGVTARASVLEFGMGVDVHGADGTKAACRAVADAVRHSSLPFVQAVRERGGRMLVDVTVGVPDPAAVDVERVRRELPHGEVTVRPVVGGLRVPGSDAVIACVAITVSVEDPAAP